MIFSPRRKTQAPQGRYTPTLWPVWLVAPLALVVVSALSFGLYHGVYYLLSGSANAQRPPKPLDVSDVIKTTVTVLTLVGAVLAGIYAYRKQLLAEGDAHRADASQLADRYTAAAEQLGHQQAAVRLAGVYALARLADDWEEQRQVCTDVLCAYLRMPYSPDPTAEEHKAGEREVRHTIIRVIRDHLQDPDATTSWCQFDFDFTGAIFDGGDLSRSIFRGRVSFVDSVFRGGRVTFNGAEFPASSLVSFNRAHFDSGTVTFRGVRFSGSAVSFDSARFNGGTVDFERAYFNDGMVTFHHAQLDSGTVSFFRAGFKGGTVFFGPAQFNGGSVTFNMARFEGGTVSFDLGQFSGSAVSFDSAQFRGGAVSFERAHFNGSTVTFNNAQFNGSAVEWGALPLPAGA
ncbi:pentapeptide repeat-containing protein [Streptomyces mirabilis]|uniref:pentapeptide repeat-containing protein n=1 Tax=Streptomyces mirabilis TaxID=68239 RepID=UPI00369953DE